MVSAARASAQEIIVRLERVQEDMDYIREHIEDVTLTEDDLTSIKEAKSDLKEGKTRRL